MPGSIDSIAVLARGAGADMAFVMSLRTIRMFAMVILGPTLATGLARMLLHRRGGRP